MIMETSKSPLRLAIEQALVSAGLGKNYDKECFALKLAIYRAEIREIAK